MKKRIGLFVMISLLAVCAAGLLACEGGGEQPPAPVVSFSYSIDLDLDAGIESKFENGYESLPSITVSTLTDGVVTDTKPYTGQMTLAENEFVYLENRVFYIKDSSVLEFSTTAALTLDRMEWDNGAGSVQFSFPLAKMPVLVTSMSISIDTRGVVVATDFYGSDFGAGAVSINPVCHPQNATYRGWNYVEYDAMYVIKSGERIEQNLENYVTVSATGTLELVGSELWIGDKIGVRGRHTKYDVVSDILEIEVIKNAVQALNLKVSSLTTVGTGENKYYDFNYTATKFNPHIVIDLTPWYATLQKDREFTIINPDDCPFVTFGEDEYGALAILIDEESFVKGKMLEFYVTVDGLVSNTCRVYIY